MNKLLILFCCIIQILGMAQSKPNLHKAGIKAKPRVSKYDLEDKNDSAHIYYLQGWDAYKAKDIEGAKLNWERGANCSSDIPSKYSSAFRYGLMLQEGEGVAVDKDAAFYYYNLGANDGKKVGDVDATKNVAAYYENGISVTQDFKKALEWYLKAKAQGNRYCDTDIARVRQKIARGL